MKKFFSSLLLLAGASLCALEITLPAKPLPSEKIAAQELRSYLERTVDGKLKIGGQGNQQDSARRYAGNTGGGDRRQGIEDRRLCDQEFRR